MIGIVRKVEEGKKDWNRQWGRGSGSIKKGGTGRPHGEGNI